MLVHFMTREDRLKVFHDFLEWQYFCEIGALSTLRCDRSLKAANFGSSTSCIHHFHYKSVPILGLKGLKTIPFVELHPRYLSNLPWVRC